ncbi:hypothetical protein [Phyllobacterium zundukense]|uniref:Uncharacterized protein n=1 Tax=Phyllobacterium zundukense TaxID=1867719 RepID=A0A2N9W4V7_9HYPH|nr:hypothetical protein [Phyllobacterium zundukense]ATU91759.1 hypothetical protein BLM14_09105 [Phyllobacterium zundukense]PIO46775.1 hypothetical protein B5P45_02970 [Phyllobacterium zundukense]
MDAWKVVLIAAAIVVGGFGFGGAQTSDPALNWQISAGAIGWRVNVHTGETWYCNTSSTSGPYCAKVNKILISERMTAAFESPFSFGASRVKISAELHQSPVYVQI